MSAAPNYRYAVCCATCTHYEQDYDAYGACNLHNQTWDDDEPLTGPFEKVCDNHELGVAFYAAKETPDKAVLRCGDCWHVPDEAYQLQPCQKCPGTYDYPGAGADRA